MNVSDLINGVQSEETKHTGALPVGMYDVAVEKVEHKTTKKGGEALNFQLRVVGEKCKNAVVFDWVNIKVPSSETATNIGLQRLKKICELTGTTEIANMMGKQLTVNVGIEKSEEYGDKNRVKGYFPMDNTVTPASMPKTNVNISTDSIPF